MEQANEQPNQETVKCVVVGDSGVGKTRMVCSRACGTRYTLPQLMQTHIPTIWAIDNYYRSPEILERSCCEVDGVDVSLRLWDTFGYHDKDRRFAFSKADVVLLCYSTVRPMSLKSAQLFWYPEIRRVCPQIPVVLVGCQIDLRYLYKDNEFLALDKGLFFQPILEKHIILPETGRQVAADIDAEYFETSSFTQYGIEHAFENVCRIALLERSRSRFSNPLLKYVSLPTCQTPALPPPNRTPDAVTIETTFRQELLELWQSSSHYDVIISILGEEIRAHKCLLISCSDVFINLLSLDLSHQTKVASQGDEISQISDDSTDQSCLLKSVERNSNWIELSHDLFSAIGVILKDGRPVTSLLVRPEVGVQAESMRQLVQFLYTGDLGEYVIQGYDKVCYALARALEMEPLVQCLQKDEIDVETGGVHFNRDRMLKIQDLLLRKGLHSDVVFRCDDGDVSAHKAMLVARCEWMKSLFNDNFRESSLDIIPLPGVHLDTLLCIQYHLYTDNVPELHNTDVISLLELANRFCLRRLVSLVQVEVIAILKLAHENGDDIIEEVLSLLEPARSFNANHLASWCMVFLCNNYYSMLKKKPKVFTLLFPDVQHYLVKHRWPPEWYLRELEYSEKQHARRELAMKPHTRAAVARRYRASKGCFCLPGCAKTKPVTQKTKIED